MAAPGSAKSSGSQDGGDAHVSAMVSPSLASDEASKYVSASMETLAAIEKSREQGWTEPLEDATGSSSRGLSEEDQLLWQKLKKEAPWTFVDEVTGLKLGQLIAEGGQAKIYEASMDGCEYPLVAKVFKMEGFSLADLHRHWPRRTVGGLTSHPFRRSKSRSATTQGGLAFDPLRCSKRRSATSEGGFAFDRSNQDFFDHLYLCFVLRGLFLADGRFAFLLQKYWGDLRTLINLRLGDKNGQGPPFSYDVVGYIIYSIAAGMRRLHRNGVLHRDLKAANVLCVGISDMEVVQCAVADFESSMLVQGTGFWRAPEVLENLSKKKEDRNKEIWTEKVDVYSFAMTCYEVMTGHIPFLGYEKKDWHRIKNGERPHLPDYVDPQLGELVERCWHKEPSKRPTFDAIVNSLSKFQGEIWHKMARIASKKSHLEAYSKRFSEGCKIQ